MIHHSLEKSGTGGVLSSQHQNQETTPGPGHFFSPGLVRKGRTAEGKKTHFQAAKLGRETPTFLLSPFFFLPDPATDAKFGHVVYGPIHTYMYACMHTYRRYTVSRTYW